MEIKTKYEIGEKVYEVGRFLVNHRPFIRYLGKVREITIAKEGNKYLIDDSDGDIRLARPLLENEFVNKEESAKRLHDACIEYIQELKDEIALTESKLKSYEEGGIVEWN